MPPEIIAPVNPRTLCRIRELVGYPEPSDVGKVPGIPDAAEKIGRWEAGESINLAEARKLARKYRVELPALYLESPPSFLEQQLPDDFRRGKEHEGYNSNLLFAIRETYFQQSWLRDYLEEIGNPQTVLPQRANPNDDTGKIASVIREWLEVGDNPEVDRPEKPAQAFEKWKKVVEDHRVIVLANRSDKGYSIEKEEYEGLALADKIVPVILLNPITGISPQRRIFTLMHELAHLFLGDSAVSTIDPYGGYAGGDSKKRSKEKWCDEVAGHVLVPSQWLKNRWIRGKNAEQQIEEIAGRIHVSREMLAIRAKEIGRISEEELNNLFRAYRGRDQQRREQKILKKALLSIDFPSEDEERHKKRQESSHTSSSESSRRDTDVALKRCGRYFSRCVLEAYQRDIINVTEIYDLTGGLKLKYLKEFAEKIGYPLPRWK